jgi:phage terminase small subunit
MSTPSDDTLPQPSPGQRTDLTGALTPLQERFVQEYLTDLNASRAAIAAGYSPVGAPRYSHDLLKIPHIQAAIEAGKRKLARKLNLRAERWLQELMHLAYSDIGDIFDFSGDAVRLKPAHEIPKEARVAIKSMRTKRYTTRDGAEVEETTVTLWDKPKALRDLGEHLGELVNTLLVGADPDNPLPANLRQRAIADERTAELLCELAERLAEAEQPGQPDRRAAGAGSARLLCAPGQRGALGTDAAPGPPQPQ